MMRRRRHDEARHAYAQLMARLEEMLKDMTEEKRNALCVSFPFPDPKDVETAIGAKDKEFRRRRHPRRKSSLREFIEDPKDSRLE